MQSNTIPCSLLSARDIKYKPIRRYPATAFDLSVIVRERHLVGEIEATLQTMGEVEVSSRVVGDMVINGLKELDHIAYIRYAIVYLGLDDLKSIRNEIDHLLEI